MKKYRVQLFLLLLVFAPLAVSRENSADDNDTNKENTTEPTLKPGVWESIGEQPGISWTIKITLNADGQLMEYPFLEYGGFPILLEEREGYLLFRKTITFNTICADQGFVELIEISGNGFDYNYYFPNTSNGLGAQGAMG